MSASIASKPESVASKPESAYLAQNGWKYDAFLLHAGENKSFVSKLYWDLCSKNILPFFDKESLEFGDPADDIMKDAVECSSRFVVPILTHELKGKPWPGEELDLALARYKRDKKQIKTVILPVFFIPSDTCQESTIASIKEISRITGMEKKEEDDEEQFLRKISEGIEKMVKKDQIMRSSSEDQTDSGLSVEASSEDDSVSVIKYAEDVWKAVDRLGGRWENWTYIPNDVVEAVCSLGADTDVLASRLGVTQGALLGMRETTIHNKTVRNILHIWTDQNGGKATLKVLFLALHEMKLLPKLQEQLRI